MDETRSLGGGGDGLGVGDGVGQQDTAVDVGGEPVLDVAIGQRLAPVRRREFQYPMGRPARQQAEEIAQVHPRLDPVHLAARQQRDEDRVGPRAVLRADEEPVLASDRLPPQLPLRDVVAQRQLPIVQKAPEGGALVERVADRIGQRRAVEHVVAVLLAPPEEALDDRLRLLPGGAVAARCVADEPRRSRRKSSRIRSSAQFARSGSDSRAAKK